MEDIEYRAFLDLMMVSDPWPLEDPDSDTILGLFADREAHNRQYENWVVAYHEMPRER